MQLQILALDMRYSFKTKTTQNILKAVLPSGRFLEFEVSEEEVTAMMALDQMEVPFDAQYQEVKPASSVENPPPPEPQGIRWMELPDHILAPFLKAELKAMDMPDVMLDEDLVKVLQGITFNKEESAQRHTAQLGVVERNVPLPGHIGDRRQARVESDERGNPVVEQRADQAPQNGFDDDTGARSV